MPNMSATCGTRAQAGLDLPKTLASSARRTVALLMVLATVGRAQEDSSTRARLATAIGDTTRQAPFLRRWALVATDSVSLVFVDRRRPDPGPHGHLIIRELVTYDDAKKAATLGYRSIIIRFEVSCPSGHLRSRRFTSYSDNMGRGQVVGVDSVPEDWGERPPPRDPQAIMVATACRAATNSNGRPD
jgi:hypothetical protein